MLQNAHPELVSAEAEGLRQSPKETAPYISTLRLRAAETSPQPGLDAGSAGITTPFGIVAECCLMHSNPVPPPAGGGCHTASRNHPTQFSEAEIPALPAMAAAAAVQLQQAYVEGRGIPWGISESAYFRMDESGNYQYYAFGVPPLALRRLDQDAPVISPYSTFLALNVDPSAVLQNLHNMHNKRWLGAYGFYEAIDFDPSRCRSWLRRHEPVRCWMAHHQDMNLLSISKLPAR